MSLASLEYEGSLWTGEHSAGLGMQHKINANTTDIVDLCPIKSGQLQDVYFSSERWQECQNELHS